MSPVPALRALDDRRRAWVARTGERWRATPRTWRWAGAAALLAVVYVLPVWEPPVITTTDTDFANVLFTAASYALVAVGLNVVVGQAGLLDLGYVGFYAVGAYTTGVLSARHAELPWLVCLPIAVVVAMVAGAILGTPTLRLRGDYLAIVTLGFGEIIRISANNIEWLGAAGGINQIPGVPGVDSAEGYYWVAVTMIVVVVFFHRRLDDSRVGRAWVAIREDEDAAELMGVPTFRFKLWAFAIGAAVGGISGSLFAAKQAFINPASFPFILSALFLAAVVLGGSGNLAGVITGAVAIAYLPERFRFLNDKRVLVFGVALVVMMIFRPQGLIPSRRRAREMRHAVDDPDLPGLAGRDHADPLGPDPDPATGARGVGG